MILMKSVGNFVFQQVKTLPRPQHQASLKEKVEFGCVGKHWAKLGEQDVLRYFISSHRNDERASGCFGKWSSDLNVRNKK